MTTTYENVQKIFEEKAYLVNQADLYFYRYAWSKFEKDGLLMVENDMDEEKHKILACALVLFYNEFIAEKEDTTCNKDFFDTEIDAFILGKFCTDITIEKEYALIHVCENMEVYKMLNKYFNINQLFFCMMLPFTADIATYGDYVKKVVTDQDNDYILNHMSSGKEFSWLSNYIG